MLVLLLLGCRILFGGGGVKVLHFKTPVNLQLCFIQFARFVNVWICGILYHLLLVSLFVFILFVL